MQSVTVFRVDWVMGRPTTQYCGSIRRRTVTDPHAVRASNPALG